MTNSDKECIICTEKLNIGRQLSCGHCFHLVCLMKWIEKGTKNCPLCRDDIQIDMTLFSNRNIIKDFFKWIERILFGLFGIRLLNVSIQINRSQYFNNEEVN